MEIEVDDESVVIYVPKATITVNLSDKSLDYLVAVNRDDGEDRTETIPLKDALDAD